MSVLQSIPRPAHFDARHRCPACLKGGVREIYRRSYLDPAILKYLVEFYGERAQPELLEDAEFVLDECMNCGLIFQRFVPDAMLSERMYSHWIAPACYRPSSLRLYLSLRREIEMILRFFAKPPDQVRLFDFGMGWGEWCRMGLAYGCSAFGFDFSEARMKHCARFGVVPIAQNEIASRRFDFINTEQVFEHLPNPHETLHLLAGSLLPGGILKISVPHTPDIRRRIKDSDWTAKKGTRNSPNSVTPLEHLNCFTRRSIETMGATAGLKSITIHSSLAPRRLVDTSARDFLLPFYRKLTNYVLLQAPPGLK